MAAKERQKGDLMALIAMKQVRASVTLLADGDVAGAGDLASKSVTGTDPWKERETGTWVWQWKLSFR